MNGQDYLNQLTAAMQSQGFPDLSVAPPWSTPAMGVPEDGWGWYTNLASHLAGGLATGGGQRTIPTMTLPPINSGGGGEAPPGGSGGPPPAPPPGYVTPQPPPTPVNGPPTNQSPIAGQIPVSIDDTGATYQDTSPGSAWVGDMLGENYNPYGNVPAVMGTFNDAIGSSWYNSIPYDNAMGPPAPNDSGLPDPTLLSILGTLTAGPMGGIAAHKLGGPTLGDVGGKLGGLFNSDIDLNDAQGQWLQSQGGWSAANNPARNPGHWSGSYAAATQWRPKKAMK